MKLTDFLLTAVAVILLTACNARPLTPDRNLAHQAIRNAASTIYVGDAITYAGSGVLLTFPAAASGDVTPTTMIRGRRTQIGELEGLAVDSARLTYAVSGGRPVVLIFKDGAHGDRMPTHTISGSLTQLSSPFDIAIDHEGDIFVKDCSGTCLLEFAPGAIGNVAPIAVVSGTQTGLNGNGRIAFDLQDNVYVLDNGKQQPAIDEFSKGSDGDAAPIRSITGPNTGLATAGGGIALDSSGQIYATLANFSTHHGVNIYAADASGDASPVAFLGGPRSGFGDPRAVALDDADRIYVGDLRNAVLVFNAGATGNVHPAQLIVGDETHLQNPLSIAVR